MEHNYFLYAFILFCSLIIKLAKKKKPEHRLPPGPKPLPIIGNLHQLSGGPAHHILRDLAKEYGPLMHLKFGEVSTIVVSSPEIAKEIFRTHDILFTQRPSNVAAFKVISYDYTGIIFSPYGHYWRQLRKICSVELLSPKRVQSFQSIREEEVMNMINSISLHESKPVNLSQEIFSTTYSITSRAAFGKRDKYQEKFIRLVSEVSELASGTCLADLYPSIGFLQLISRFPSKLQKTHKQVDEILESILNKHKENFKKLNQEDEEEKEDLVDVLLNIQKRGDFETPLTDSNIKAVIYDIFSAGGETSSSIVEWAMSEMIKNPSIAKRAQVEVRNLFSKRGNVDESNLHELKYLKAVIKETLRLHPSAPLLVPRECRQQCEINRYQIPAKARVFINAWAICRDPRYWIEAEKFNPDRFLDSEMDYKGINFEYIPFGAGRRMCPGISFGIPNIELQLAQLLFHFDWKVQAGLKPEELDMSESIGVSTRRKNDLYLVPLQMKKCEQDLIVREVSNKNQL